MPIQQIGIQVPQPERIDLTEGAGGEAKQIAQGISSLQQVARAGLYQAKQIQANETETLKSSLSQQYQQFALNMQENPNLATPKSIQNFQSKMVDYQQNNAGFLTNNKEIQQHVDMLNNGLNMEAQRVQFAQGQFTQYQGTMSNMGSYVQAYVTAKTPEDKQKQLSNFENVTNGIVDPNKKNTLATAFANGVKANSLFGNLQEALPKPLGDLSKANQSEINWAISNNSHDVLSQELNEGNFNYIEDPRFFNHLSQIKDSDLYNLQEQAKAVTPIYEKLATKGFNFGAMQSALKSNTNPLTKGALQYINNSIISGHSRTFLCAHNNAFAQAQHQYQQDRDLTNYNIKLKALYQHYGIPLKYWELGSDVQQQSLQNLKNGNANQNDYQVIFGGGYQNPDKSITTMSQSDRNAFADTVQNPELKTSLLLGLSPDVQSIMQQPLDKNLATQNNQKPTYDVSLNGTFSSESDYAKLNGYLTSQGASSDGLKSIADKIWYNTYNRTGGDKTQATNQVQNYFQSVASHIHTINNGQLTYDDRVAKPYVNSLSSNDLRGLITHLHNHFPQTIGLLDPYFNVSSNGDLQIIDPITSDVLNTYSKDNVDIISNQAIANMKPSKGNIVSKFPEGIVNPTFNGKGI